MLHRPVADGEPPPSIPFASRVEYVGGPRDAQLEDLDELPEVIGAGVGEYRRSVRCAEDGALRYVWHDLATRHGRT